MASTKVMVKCWPAHVVLCCDTVRWSQLLMKKKKVFLKVPHYTHIDMFFFYNAMGQWAEFTQSIILQKNTDREKTTLSPSLQASRQT